MDKFGVRFTNKYFLILLMLSMPLWAAPSVDNYGRLPYVEAMEISPSGERYAFIASRDNKRKLVVMDVGSNKILRVVNAGEEKIRGLRWVNDERILVYKSALEDKRHIYMFRHELWGVINVDLRDGSAKAIFKDTRAVSQTVFGTFRIAQIDGEWFGYFGGIGHGRTGASSYWEDGYRDLYRVSLETNSARKVESGTPTKAGWVVSDAGEVMAEAYYDDDTGLWSLLVDSALGGQSVQRSAKAGWISLLGTGRTEHSAIISYMAEDEDVIEEIDLKDGTSDILLRGYEKDSLLRDPISGLLIGFRISESPGAKFFDPGLQAKYEGTRKAFPGYQMELISFNHDGSRLIVKTDGGDDSGTFWMVDISSSSAKPIAESYPDIKSNQVGKTQWITYSAQDGLEIEAVLTLPPDQKPEKLPLIVMPHGGPIGPRDELGFDYWAQAFAVSGYAVLQPNYRGSSGYGYEFMKAGFGEWGGKMQTDLSDGVAYLSEQGMVDPKRVCIVGGSYGGYAALAGVTLQNDIYRCAVSLNGVSDLSSLFNWKGRRYKDRNTVMYWYRKAFGAEEGGNKKMNAISPAQLADRSDAPVLLIHGEDDTVVPIEQSQLMKRALKKAGKSVKFIELDEDDHWVSRDDTRRKMVNASVEFVKKHNPPR